MTQKELDEIVEQHRHWLKRDCEDWEYMKADLRGANLCDANLNGVNLRHADLRRANLCNANLFSADLSGANLREADLCKARLNGADLSGANLCDANLVSADLSGADLRRAYLCNSKLRLANLYEANLRGANLYRAYLNGANLGCVDLDSASLRRAYLNGANLYGAHLSGVDLYAADLSWANLSGANLSGDYRFRLGKILYEPLTGYKKTKEGVVITAKIPVGAIVFCINGGKCRTNRAKITDMAGHEVLHSDYDKFFEYRLGQEIEIKDFDLTYNVECTRGFHFFRTRKEAEEY